MKKYLITFFALIALLIQAQSQSLIPDSVWLDKYSTWYANGLTFYNYHDSLFTCIMDYEIEENWAGNTEIINYTLSPSFYVFNRHHHNESPMTPLLFYPTKDNHIYTFGYPDEWYGTYKKYLIGNNFFFEYNGQLWYFDNVQNKNTPNENYECFVRLDRVHNTNSYYFDKKSPVSEVIKRGAFQLDSLLFFIGINQNKSSPYYNYWCLQQYSYDSASDKLVPGSEYYLTNIKNSQKFGGYARRFDSLNRVSLLLDTYNPGTPQNYIGLLTYAKNQSGYQFSYKTIDSVTYNNSVIGSLSLASGSMKGSKASDANPGLTDRIAYTMISSTKGSDGNYPMYYREFYISPANKLTVMNQGAVTLASHPAAVSDHEISNSGNVFDLACGTELIPVDLSGAIPGNDAFQSRIDFFYPDKSGHINAAEFESDKFLNDNKESVQSDDLYDLQKYPYIKGLWSLIGIIDGAPPCPVDWDKWNANHVDYNNDHPTTLSLTLKTSHTKTVTTSWDDQWSVGANFKKLGDEHENSMIGSLGLKYQGAYQNQIKKSSTFESSFAQDFSLTEALQGYGRFIYSVPSIERFQYDCYPWWDTVYAHRIPNTLQYLFRTYGTTIVNQQVPLSQYPFYINHPNDTSMADWKLGTGYSRQMISDQGYPFGVLPLTPTISWVSPDAGADLTLDSTFDYSNINSHKNGFSVESSIGTEVPKVFTTSLNTSYEFSYTTSTENETTNEFEVDISLAHLELASIGPMISELYLEAYYLKDDSMKQGTSYVHIPWYFYDSLKGAKPFYIAYLVTVKHSKLNLLSPRDEKLPRQSGLLFAWDTEGDELSDFTVFVYKSASTGPSTIIYSKSTGGERSLNPLGFVPEKGKTYYWKVRGRAGNGDVIWSPTGSFSVETPPQEGTVDVSTLKTVVYPNPGQCGEVKVAFSAEEAGSTTCTVYTTEGVPVYHASFFLAGSGQVTTIQIPSSVGRGIYLVETIGNGQRVVRKMLIL